MCSSNNLDALFADAELPIGHPGRNFDDSPAGYSDFDDLHEPPPVDLDETKELLGKFIEQKPHEWYEDIGEGTDQAKGKPIETGREARRQPGLSKKNPDGT